MIRAPGLNTILNSARTVRQVLSRQNAFEEAVEHSQGVAAAASSSPKLQTLQLRDLTSSLLWLRSCAGARRKLADAFKAGDASAVEMHLTRFGALMKLSQALAGIRVLRPSWLTPICQNMADKWYMSGVRQGLEEGHVKPGKTRGVHAHTLLRLRVERSTEELMEKEMEQRQKFSKAVQKGMAGSGSLDLTDEDLIGLTDPMKSIWASRAGSWAVWRGAKYKVPVNRDSIVRIMPFCQNASTRTKLFEAFNAGFGDEVNIAALELLQTRQRLAGRYGFKTWAEYQVKPLSIGEPSAVHRMMDQCWQDLQPSLAPILKRMSERSAAVASRGTSSKGLGGKLLANVAHEDEAFLRALITREADTWKLAEFLPATGTGGGAMTRLLDIVGRAYNVHFVEVMAPDSGRYLSGWDKGVKIYEVCNGPSPGAVGQKSTDRLGFVYLDLYSRTGIAGRASTNLAGAELLCSGHAYLSMNFSAASWGHNKLLNPEEVVAIMHELGHAVHMLCYEGNFQEFEDLPLDVLELPSTFIETIAINPNMISQYARHYASGGPPPDSLIRSCQRDAYFYTRYLQGSHVALGLHGDAFDPHSATPTELQDFAVSLWQRYSPVVAHTAFTPFSEDSGLYLGQGANHIAYLLCYLRVDAILNAPSRGAAPKGALAAGAARGKDHTQRWLSPEFAGKVRTQLLDRTFSGQRLALLLPPLGDSSDLKPPPHPLPPPPTSGASLFGRVERWAS